MLAVIWAIPVLILVRHVSPIVWGLLVAPFQRLGSTITIETTAGMFVRERLFWAGTVEFEGRTLDVTARDVDGRPNPVLLDQLGRIIGELTDLEKTARVHVEGITDEHRLEEVADDPHSEFVLGFNRDDGTWGETVYVGFKGREVDYWTSVD